LGKYAGGLEAVPLAGSRGRAPGKGVWRAKPPEAESFMLHKYLIQTLYFGYFLNISEYCGNTASGF